MVNSRLKQDGVSLIELMVTITILGILVITGTSLTAVWSKQVELDKATISLKSAFNLSRSTAIRNQFAQKTSYVASQICFDIDSKKLSVHKATETEFASCDSPIVFSYPLSQTIDIKNTDTTNFRCFSFNNFGQISNQTTGNCQINLSLNISNGSLNETINLN